MIEPTVEDAIARLFAMAENSFGTLYPLGEAFMEIGLHADAVRALERAHELRPNHAKCAAKRAEAKAALAKDP